MSLKISAAVFSHIGHRSNNEDNFYFNGLYMEREQMNKGGQIHSVVTENEQMFAVCDGMGGAELGEEASLKAVQMLREYQQTCLHPDSSTFLDEAIGNISAAVDGISISHGMASGDCGSTLAMILLKDWSFRTVHVGDSRVYLLRKGKMSRVTKDDSKVQIMVDEGEITPDEAWQHPEKNIITRHLGMPMEDGEKLKPTISERKDLMAGDRFLLCSDGLTDQVHETIIRDILMNVSSAAEAASTLVHKALTEAEHMELASDNVTVIVLDIVKAGEKDDNQKRIHMMQGLRGLLIALIALLAGGLGWAGYELVTFLLR
ncbi:MAG: serine/threonine-protein phosphatase [Clostridia bacterium]|nr:serine/threonine-protein phosphatase [Clostridia bacterium]MBR4726974.1 serine/threonine-protein phosphatase [Clostridia bacterium]